jgi:hypothetical protein
LGFGVRHVFIHLNRHYATATLLSVLYGSS